MEDHAAHGVTDLLASLPLSVSASLASIRHWENLQVARTDEAFWLKGFTSAQAASATLRQLPSLEVFTVNEGLLFTEGRMLPARRMPTGLLWTAIAHAFPVDFENVNHNFFGITDTIAVRLVATETPQEATALLTPLNTLLQAVETLAAIRLQPLNWTIVGSDALLIGKPLLPLPGQAYWQRGRHLLPAGLDFEYPAFAQKFSGNEALQEADYLLWPPDDSVIPITASMLVPLSRSSVRLSQKH